LTDTPSLREFGYSERWETLFAPYAADGLVLGRVVRADRGSSAVSTETGIVRAQPSVRLRKSAKGLVDLPAVGDWAVMSFSDDMAVAQVEAVLDRTSAVKRGDPGNASGAQVLAANVDVVFVVHPISAEPNVRRIERELSLAWESGAVPVVILTKVDMSEDPDAACAAVKAVAPGVDVRMTNALLGDGVEELREYIRDYRTAVLLGPSGAGKSTLVNALVGYESQATQEVRLADGKGRHTTVARELILVPDGGIVIDTPGLRALGLTGSEEGISAAFPEIEQLASMCRFQDCAHEKEPGCAVQAAVESGQLSVDRLASYQKLLRAAQVAEARTDPHLGKEEKHRAKVLAKLIKNAKRHAGD